MRRVPEVECVSQALAHHVLSGRLVVVHTVLDDIGKTEAHPARSLRGVGHIRTVGKRQIDVHRVRHLILGQDRSRN